MHKDALALVGLLGVMVVGMIGAALFLSGSNRRAALAARGRDDSGGSEVRALLNTLDTRLRATKSGGRLAQWLRASGGGLTPIDFVAIVVVGGFLASLVMTFLTPPIVAFVLGYVFVVLGLRWWVERLRAKRREAFMDQLPDLARMLSNGTQAGLSIAGAVQMAARELDDPAAAEMAAVVQEMRLGQPLDVALERLQKRLPSREVAVLMTTLIIQQRAGGDTVRALSELGQTLEARKDLLREIRTMLSGAVFTSYLVAGMGAGTILMINAISPGIMRELTTTPIGLLALTASVTLYVVAFVLIRRLTRVET
jgi:tight adherence protein B